MLLNPIYEGHLKIESERPYCSDLTSKAMTGDACQVPPEPVRKIRLSGIKDAEGEELCCTSNFM